MNIEFKLEEYLSNGVENIVKGAIKASLKNPKESVFIANYMLEVKKSRKIRQKQEAAGEHIPPFLIASITNSCNLHCKGCYARANKSCTDKDPDNQLTDKEWNLIFEEAGEIGISFILLAGGEPMLRKEVIQTAAKHKNIIFPIFTNGTLIDEDYITLLNHNRNLIPVFSIEGDSLTTDERRGAGIYSKLLLGMNEMKNKGILYGTSITVSKKNLEEVTQKSFLSALNNLGCKVIFYVEYVPVTTDTIDIAPSEDDRLYLEKQLLALRKIYDDMIFISFPGDEKSSGGCLAAGRGFFHINYQGGVEPCPFSPYSDTNLKSITLKEALQSPFFKKLRNNNILLGEHKGGCILFENKDIVETLIN
ncbi:radical SAM protein [Anaerocolumna sp. MB42-C2]|uniref:radical SAM protein n=1 Tax=Anaerocolumna sp. MB42-C2 TaxID=3070997 RepID=UPI0027E187A5|nr:radical SAM protein [Anaerocolumna sp. MB42-C2]WMJ88360.1 radical SAM protein [Anaerocolumna sp. MB42-C2]